MLSRILPNRAFICTPSRLSRTSVMAASSLRYNVVVKGDPVKQVLGDCPFCHRVLLTMETKGLSYTSDYVDFSNKPEWLIQTSGGKVPVLRGPNDFVLADSDEIVKYLEKEHPTPSMKSEVDPSVGSKLFPAFRGYLFSPAGADDEGAKKDALISELKFLNEALSGIQGPLFGGHTLNATDAAIAPKLYHCQVALAHFKSFQIPEEFTAVHGYLTAVKQLPAWKAVDYGAHAIIQGWQKHLDEGK